MDVIGRARHAGAMAADDGLERVVKPAVVGVGCSEALARGFDALA
jgi:hypothetical protein